MTNQTTNSRVLFSPKVAMFFAVLLFGSFGFNSPDIKPDASPASKMFGLFVNEKHLHIFSDSLDINEKGTLSLRELVDETPGKDHVSFRILIVHHSFAGKILLFPWKEVFQNGAAMESVELHDVLQKTTIGEQLIIIPSTWEHPLENPKGEFVITVSGRGC